MRMRLWAVLVFLISVTAAIVPGGAQGCINPDLMTDHVGPLSALDSLSAAVAARNPDRLLQCLSPDFCTIYLRDGVPVAAQVPENRETLVEGWKLIWGQIQKEEQQVETKGHTSLAFVRTDSPIQVRPDVWEADNLQTEVRIAMPAELARGKAPVSVRQMGTMLIGFSGERYVITKWVVNLAAEEPPGDPASSSWGTIRNIYR